MSDKIACDELDEQELAELLVDVEVTVGGRDVGTMTFEFWPQAAPETVRNFLRYAAEGFYDGLGFHRVIPGFMIQGGCPQGTGTGSGPRGRIRGEFGREPERSHKRGVISMARAQDPDSASCQFFICHGDAEFLDGQYASFGALIAGEEALDAVAAVPTGGGGENSTPLERCEIRRMTVRRRS
ncbi:MAG: peptidylprolyl isomerase [Planctomycetota bacterium]|nr:MAG: peptidylprolyl isomerase [Planctomycetota bacterium]